MVAVEPIGAAQWARARTTRLRALRDTPDAFSSTAAQESTLPEHDWRARLERTDAVTLLAVVGGVDVGMVVGAPHHEQPADAGLYAMWVAPEARGQGVGDALITAVADWARTAGYPRLRLDVADANARAVRLYERMGFAPTGVTTRFPAPRSHIVEHERVLELCS